MKCSTICERSSQFQIYYKIISQLYQHVEDFQCPFHKSLLQSRRCNAEAAMPQIYTKHQMASIFQNKSYWQWNK